MNASNSIQRRRFLASCLVVAGAAGLLPASAALASTTVRRTTFFKPTLAMLTKADFAPCRGTIFHMQISPEQSIPLELIDVSGYPERAMTKGASREPFSLLFRGAKELQLSQRIFHLSHPDLGAHELFLVPLGPDDQGMCFEAVFS